MRRISWFYDNLLKMKLTEGQKPTAHEVKVTVKRTLLYNINKAGNKLLTEPLGKPYKVSELFISYSKYE